MNLKIIVKGMESKPLVWDSKKYSLISFLSSVLNAAYMVSHKDTVTELDVNGKKFSFPSGKVKPSSEALPKVEKIDIQGNNKTVLKLNYIGFILNSLFSGINSFKGLNIHSDSNTNKAIEKETSVIGLINVLTKNFTERKAERRAIIATSNLNCAKFGIGSNIKHFNQIAKVATLEYNELIAPKQISEATIRNEATKSAKAELAAKA